MTGRLPHFTIQMPVYKEGLEGVIIPTVESLKKAITTYERQGGSVNIFLFDDGMQIWDEEEQEIRKAYYDRNNIGWTARPKHGANGYIRKGRFKKVCHNAVATLILGFQHELWQRPVSSCRRTHGRKPTGNAHRP
jgi:hypothetical protein